VRYWKRTICEFSWSAVATVYEASGRESLIDVSFELAGGCARAAGPARTVRCGQGDNLAVHAAMIVLAPGEVLVLTMPEPAPVALLGDLLATQARVRGAVAVLVDAAMRDAGELGMPVWARWVRVAARRRPTAARSTCRSSSAARRSGRATIPRRARARV
jgi:4-hydroxy-4-methyl-2-oxoglutarate aldolase